MESLEPKKLALIRILQILQYHSDCDHPIIHDKIVEFLKISLRNKEKAERQAKHLLKQKEDC